MRVAGITNLYYKVKKENWLNNQRILSNLSEEKGKTWEISQKMSEIFLKMSEIIF
jgi:hypothetical protein